jgi:hypothetical protein
MLIFKKKYSEDLKRSNGLYIDNNYIYFGRNQQSKRFTFLGLNSLVYGSFCRKNIDISKSIIN